MNLQPDLTGKVAIVTGAGRGIGKATSLAIASCGAHVVLAARTESQLDEVATEIVNAGGRASKVITDVADEQSILNLFNHVNDEHGRLDVMINNAGLGIFGKLAEFETADLNTIMKINVDGTFICCREAMKMMIPNNSGYIINISSVVGIKGYPNQAAYTASKHAVVGMTKSLAVEAQENNIRVSVIHPGGVDTDMVAQARPDLDRSILMTVDDIAQSVMYLLSLSDSCSVDEIYIRRRTSSPF
jgi:NAD(P)-dependent dehydrogenase (short-subunit alcohol dehydrogenase family)